MKIGLCFPYTQDGLDRETTWFTDDSSTNVIAARDLGLRAEVFMDAAECRASLVALGLIDQ